MFFAKRCGNDNKVSTSTITLNKKFCCEYYLPRDPLGAWDICNKH